MRQILRGAPTARLTGFSAPRNSPSRYLIAWLESL
jgi:hypothetical protein